MQEAFVVSDELVAAKNEADQFEPEEELFRSKPWSAEIAGVAWRKIAVDSSAAPDSCLAWRMTGVGSAEAVVGPQVRQPGWCIGGVVE